jgi:hypothetical protein
MDFHGAAEPQPDPSGSRGDAEVAEKMHRSLDVFSLRVLRVSA